MCRKVLCAAKGWARSEAPAYDSRKRWHSGAKRVPDKPGLETLPLMPQASSDSSCQHDPRPSAPQEERERTGCWLNKNLSCRHHAVPVSCTRNINLCKWYFERICLLGLHTDSSGSERDKLFRKMDFIYASVQMKPLRQQELHM